MTDSQAVFQMTYSLHSSRHPKSLINLPLKKVLINKFSAFTDDNGDSVEAHISSSKKCKPTNSDNEQTLINLTSKWKDYNTSLNKTVGHTSSIGAVSKPKKPQQDRKPSKDQ